MQTAQVGASRIVMAATEKDFELARGRDIPGCLVARRERGATRVPAVGCQMIGRHVPYPSLRLATELTVGAPHHDMNKFSIVDPNIHTISGHGPRVSRIFR
jgi:hypothetical protein